MYNHLIYLKSNQDISLDELKSDFLVYFKDKKLKKPDKILKQKEKLIIVYWDYKFYAYINKENYTNEELLELLQNNNYKDFDLKAINKDNFKNSNIRIEFYWEDDFWMEYFNESIFLLEFFENSWNYLIFESFA